MSSGFRFSTSDALVLIVAPLYRFGWRFNPVQTRPLFPDSPVIERLRREGHAVRGPLPADTAFTRTRLDACDAVIAMYHDQGLPVLKHAGFGSSVNITLGLPFVRTSPDHGTALDVAGSGKANPSSFIAALNAAQSMAASVTPA